MNKHLMLQQSIVTVECDLYRGRSPFIIYLILVIKFIFGNKTKSSLSKWPNKTQTRKIYLWRFGMDETR